MTILLSFGEIDFVFFLLTAVLRYVIDKELYAGLQLECWLLSYLTNCWLDREVGVCPCIKIHTLIEVGAIINCVVWW